MKLHNLALSISLGLSASMATMFAEANPTGAQVVSGQVTFTQPNLNTLQITNSNGAVINWQDFSINANELTHFQQSGANSSVLNQVAGSNVSNILGSLTSNGQVYLINKNGIVFGENAIVNTAGFIASTLNLSNQDFLDSKLNFQGVNAGDILNQGFITAGANGDIALIAPNIINEGVIQVENGDVILAAGEKVTLTSLSASDVGFEIQSAENTITNLGSVETDGGAIGMFSGSLNHSGSIKANALALDENGNVILVAKQDINIAENSSISANGEKGGRVLVQSENGTTWVSGEITASGANGQGGVVDVLGNNVGLIDNAVIDASGTQGGGNIHIGGNYQGKGLLQNASATYVGEKVSLSANAVESGNGGEVIVWADEAARIHGFISAKGGLESGDGGFVETSGKIFLDVSGIGLDLGATNGEAGSWLLDPFNLQIVTAGDIAIGTAPDFSSTAIGSTLNIATLTTQLNAGTNITIDTGVSGGEAGDILFDAALILSGAAPVSLTLDAANDITLSANASISSSNSAFSLVLTADSSKNDLSNNLGAININSTSIFTNGGSVTLNAGSGINFASDSVLNAGVGNVTMNTTTGNITFSAGATGALVQTTSGNISLTSQSGNISLLSATAPSNINSSLGGQIEFVADEINLTGNVATTAGGVVSLRTWNVNTPIQLVTSDFVSAGNLIIGSDELANISGDLVIGSLVNNSPIDINSPVVYTGGNNLALLTTNNINFNQTGGTAIDVGAATLNLQADKISDNSAMLDLLASAIDIQTVNGTGFAFGGEIDTQTDNLTFNNSTTGSVAVNNTSAVGLFVSGINTSADAGTSIQVDDSSPVTTLGDINGGANGDISITNFGGDVTLSVGTVISGGANATQHLLSASGVITFGTGSAIHNNGGISEVVFDAFDIDLVNGVVDVPNGKVWIYSSSFLDIGLGDTATTTGVHLDNQELDNINAAALGVGDISTSINIGGNIDMGLLGYDLFLSAGGALTFQAGSGINTGGGKLILYAPNFDFATNTPVIQGTGVLEFVNLSDAPVIELNSSCISQTSAVCITQTNLNNLVDGFSLIRFVDQSPSAGGIDINAAMTFVDAAEFDTTFTNGNININAPIDLGLGLNDIFMYAGTGAINFNQTTGTSGIIANNISLTAGTISNISSTTLLDISGNQLSFLTDSGFGNTSKPFYTSVNEIQNGQNTDATFEIFIDNESSLLVTSLRQGANAGLSTTVEANGNLTVGQIDGGGNTVVLDTTAATNGSGGEILDNGIATPNINNAYRAELYSETGVGTLVNQIELNNLNETNAAGGGVFASAAGSGDIYLNNVGGTFGLSFDVQAMTSNATGSVFIHNAVQPMNIYSSILTTAGDITLESNSDINLVASLNSGNGNVNVSVLGGTGDVNVSGGVLSNNVVSLSNSVGNILFSPGSFIMAPSVNLTAAGNVNDSGATNAIGGGTAVNFLNVNAGTGIALMGSANDASQVSLTTTSGNIDYNDANSFVLNAAYATSDSTATGAATGDVNLYSLGAISDANGAGIDVAALNAYLQAETGIGIGDAIDSNIAVSMNFANNVSGGVEFNDMGTANLQFYGYNNSATATDLTSITHVNGILTIPSSLPFVSPSTDLSMAAPQINIDGTVTGNNVILRTDELVMSAGGSVNATADVGIETLTDGTPIFLSSVDNGLALDISAAEVSQIIASRLSIGVVNQPGTNFNSGNITFSEAINTGTMDTRFITAGDIILSQGAATAFTNASVGGSEFNTQGAIIDQSTGTDIAATNILLVANTGIGNGNAIETQVSNLDVSNNATGNIEINNTGALTLVSAVQAAAADFILSNTADITIPSISMAGGNLSLLSTGGQLLSDGTNPSITNAAQVTLSGANGIGTIVNPFILNQLGSGGLSASVTATGNMYINNVNTNAVDFILTGLSINSGSAFIDNQDAAVNTRINGVFNGNGLATVTSVSDMQVDGNFNMTATGGVDLQVSGAGNSIFVNSALIRSVTGDISLLANTDIQLLGTADIQTTAPGLVTLTATNGQVFADPGATISGGANLNVSAQTAIALTGANNVNQLAASVTAGDIDFSNTGNLALGLVSAPGNTVVNITSGGAISDANAAANNVTAQVVSLNAANGIGVGDAIETEASNHLQFYNSASGDVFITDAVAVLLSGTNAAGNVDVSFNGNMQLFGLVSASGNLSLASVTGNIQDSNAAALNLSAANISLSAFDSIGAGDAIETELTAANGNITLINSSTVPGDFEIENQAINSTDVARLNATNNAIGGTLFFANNTGVTEIGSVTTNGFIEVKSAEVLLNGVLNNNDASGVTAVVFVTDEFDVNTGTINAGLGDVSFETLTEGRLITLGGIDASNTSLDLVQTDMDAITAARLSIGVLDPATIPAFGSGDITVVGGFDVGAKDIRLQAFGNIAFKNGAVSGLSTTGMMELNTAKAVIGDNSSGVNLAASDLNVVAVSGIGSVDAIRTSVSNLSVLNKSLNNINVGNTGALALSSSANNNGSMSIKSDNTLTLLNTVNTAGTTGAVASVDVTLEAATGLSVQGVVSGANVNLLSANGVTVSDTIVASKDLLMSADTDASGTGNLLIENTTGGILKLSAANIDINAAAVSLNATSGAVHIESAGLLNLVAANDVNITGGNSVDADAYLSAAGDIALDVGGNLTVSGGAGTNTAASVFDVTAGYANVLNMKVGGNVALSGGAGDNSGAYLTAKEVNALVTGNVTLTAAATAVNSSAKLASVGGSIAIDMSQGDLTFVDGADPGSIAQVSANDGLGYLSINYKTCTGCDTGLNFLDVVITNTPSQEIVGSQNNTVIGSNNSVSSSDVLVAMLDQEGAPVGTENTAGATSAENGTQDEEDKAAEEAEPEAKVLVCR